MLGSIAAPAPSSTKPVRVLVIEGQALFAKALCQVLASDPEIDVVGDSDSMANAPLRRLRPDLIVLDLDGHHVEFSEAMRTCREHAPQAKVCVLSTHVQPEVMQRCLSAGADGYVVKDILPVELIRAVKRRSNGFGRAAQNELSVRETEIIRLIARGMSNKEISAKLHLSEKTVKNHISRIFAKLNITARTQAAVHAIKTGLA